jgi:pimeloyl-ACP methyl ester carboxylesterase
VADQTETLPGHPPCVVHHHAAKVNGIRLHYVEAEPQAGPVMGSGRLCVALHGFPEFWYSWRRQIPALSAAGFRVIAPDLRGYNLSDKPASVAFYHLESLSGDVAGLVQHVGEGPVRLAGHDWGGVIAWHLAIQEPGLVERLVILNAPHPAAYRRELRRPTQLLKSWYVFFFQLPWLPEQFIRAGRYAGLRRTLRQEPVHRGAFTPQDIRLYQEALDRPGALTAGLNYYRAAFRRNPWGEPWMDRPVRVPTLLIWGEQDRYLSLGLTRGLEKWVPDLRIERLRDASHWVQNDVPEQVNRLLIDFFREGLGPRSKR